MKKLLLLAVIMLVGCQQTPVDGFTLWEQPDPEAAAKVHAKEVGGTAVSVGYTGSMEPVIAGGDWIVINPNAKFEDIAKKDVCAYLPNQENLEYYPGLALGTIIVHMAAAPSGREWIMSGIANEHYEKGILRMRAVDFKGKVERVYTKRKKP